MALRLIALAQNGKDVALTNLMLLVPAPKVVRRCDSVVFLGRQGFYLGVGGGGVLWLNFLHPVPITDGSHLNHWPLSLLSSFPMSKYNAASLHCFPYSPSSCWFRNPALYSCLLHCTL